MKNLIEIRWHGRGGQGAITAAQLLAEAAYTEGKYPMASPSFGAERRGAPIMASTRISDGKIYRRSQIKNPDIVIVLDDTLLDSANVTDGLEDDGIIIINSKKTPKELGLNAYKVYSVDVTSIAEELNLYSAGSLVLNTPILGAIIKVLKITSLENIKKIISKKFPNDNGINALAAEKTYEITEVD
ncbi:MAG: pyruvate ferredoxin oxidoreductase [Candidatus Lokiarchaeota archaeon]|nr:pyruvate ferredoxin oxidoreductase [Candidatus Lokiarchaeota archaeon]